MHFTSALFASHEAREICFCGNGDANGMKRLFWKSERRGHRCRIAWKVVSMRSCCAFLGCCVCVPWSTRNLSVENGDASDAKECSGSAVLERRGCRCGMASNVILVGSCALFVLRAAPGVFPCELGSKRHERVFWRSCAREERLQMWDGMKG